MKIKVLNITEEGRGGGPLKRIRSVSSLLYAKGVHTKVLFPKSNSEEFANKLKEAKVDYYQIGLHRLTKEKAALFKYVLLFIPELFSILSLIRKEKIDVVHCNGAWQVKGIIASKLSSSKSLWHMNDSYQPGAVRWLFRIFGSWSDGYIYASARTKRYYQAINHKIKSKPSLLIQAPVDTEAFVPKNEATISETKERISLITVGYVNPNKGLETLIRAMHALLLKGEPAFKLSIVGTIFESQNEYYAKLSKLISEFDLEDHIDFLGYRSDVRELLHSSDIYVCSSDFEASPIAVWEALSSGCLVVSTDVGDVKEIFDNENCGLVVPTQKPELLADAIAKIAQQKDQHETYRKNARAAATKLFSLEAVVNGHTQIYNRLVSRS